MGFSRDGGQYGEPNNETEKAMSMPNEPVIVKPRTKRRNITPIPKPTSHRTILGSQLGEEPSANSEVGGSYSRPLAESSTITAESHPFPSRTAGPGIFGEEGPAGSVYSHPQPGTAAESYYPKNRTRPAQTEFYGSASELDSTPLSASTGTSDNFSAHPVAGPSVERRIRFVDHQVMLTLMKSLLGKKASQKTLLECRGEKAQQVLDIMQKLLDNTRVDDVSKRSILVATLRLCKESGDYPACLTLQGVQCEGRPIADGKFGEIWRGHFRGNVVCMKVVKLYQRSQVEHLIKNFAREAIVWSQLSHPNLLPFYGIYHWDDRVCLVSPWMSNGNISEYLKAHPEAPRRPLVNDILVGLAHLHEKSIVHGDLKGVNILVTSSGTACLADFGLSSVIDADILRWTSLETVSCTGGTLRWEAPELFDDNDEDEVPRPTFAADIYSVASVMYEVLTGRIPFYEIARDATVMKKIMTGMNPSKPPPDVQLEMSHEIWEVMEQCWDRTPGNRPTVGTIIKRLQQISLNPLTMTRMAQWQARGGNGTPQLLTPSFFRAAIQGSSRTFSAFEFNLLKEMLR